MLVLAWGCSGSPGDADVRAPDPGPDLPDAPGDPGSEGDPGPGADVDGDSEADLTRDLPGDDPVVPGPGDPGDGDPATEPGEIPDLLPDIGPEATEACPPFPPPQVAGNLDGSDLVEASGLVASRVHRGVLWSHNDSGDTPRVFAIRLPDRGGDRPGPGADPVTEVLAFPLAGIQVSDCEDIAIGPFAGIDGDALFLADTGNNGGGRTVLSLYVFPEPAVLDGAAISDIRRIDVSYPDGTHDCESLFVDPWTGDVLFVVKEYALDTTRIYRLPAPTAETPAVPTMPALLDLVAEFPFATATAADMSPDGLLLAIRGYFDGRLFRRSPGQTIPELLATPPCVLPAFLEEPYNEAQGEALAFDVSGTGFYTVSERLIFPQDIHYTALP